MLDTNSKSSWFLVCYTLREILQEKALSFIAGIAKEKLQIYFTSIMVSWKPKISKGEKFQNSYWLIAVKMNHFFAWNLGLKLEISRWNAVIWASHCKHFLAPYVLQLRAWQGDNWSSGLHSEPIYRLKSNTKWCTRKIHLSASE